jgi:flagellar secretion chaperone FliS
MAIKNPWNSYRQVATQTASPGQLVLMLYDGAIRFLEHARRGFAHEDPSEANEAIHNNLSRAQDILHELNMSLNMEAGGEFSTRMRALYTYMDRRLFEANVTKTCDGIEEVLKRLETLRDAWGQVLQGQSLSPSTDRGERLIAA